MADLSPAARAVLTAVTWKKYDVPPEGLPAFAEEMAPLIAAALRAAADHVVPEGVTWESPFWQARHWPSAEERAGRQDEAWRVRHQLLAIAAELEGANG